MSAQPAAEHIMSTKYTHTECFEFFGRKPKNTYWSWSARNEGTKTVVVTLWQDELKSINGGLSYSRIIDPSNVDKRLGNRELLDNLAWAQSNADGAFKVIIAIAKDPKDEPRPIKECFPHPKFTMRVTSLDTETGFFSAEQI